MKVDQSTLKPETTRNNNSTRNILDDLETDYDFINRKSQNGFRYRYLLQEKHNRKYIKQWRNSYFPKTSERDLQNAKDSQLKIQQRRDQEIINKMDKI